jgi:hypothetical protein
MKKNNGAVRLLKHGVSATERLHWFVVRMNW